MSSPIFDEEEIENITAVIRKLVHIENSIIENGMRFSHITGQLHSPEKPPDDSIYFTRVIDRLVENNTFIGLETSRGHYLTKAWEIYKVLSWLDRIEGKRVLNIGGGSTLINFYLASIGYEVTSIDCCWRGCDLVENEKVVAENLNLPIESIKRDILEYDGVRVYDAVFSICVIEHIETRQHQKKFIEKMMKHTAPNGLLMLTFGYGKSATCNPFRNEKDIETYLYSYMDGCRIVEPFRFRGLWTISEEHTWGFIAAQKEI